MNLEASSLLGEAMMRDWDRAYRMAQRLLQNPEAASDAVQEAISRGLMHAASFDRTRPVRPWFLRIVRNVALNEAKRSRRYAAVPEIADNASPADDVLRAEQRAMLLETIAALPPAYREVVVLRYFKEYRYCAISSALSIPLGTTKTLLHRAHRAMRTAILSREVA